MTSKASGTAVLLLSMKRIIKDRKSLSLSALTSSLILESSLFQVQQPSGRARYAVPCQSIHSAMMDAGLTRMVILPMFQKKSSPRTSSMSWSVLPSSMVWQARLRNYDMLFRNRTSILTLQRKSNTNLFDNISNMSNTI